VNAYGVGIGVRGWLITSLFERCEGHDVPEPCMRRQIWGYFAGLQLSGMAAAAGAGLLAYGIAVRKSGPSRMTNLRLAPEIGWSHTGFSLLGSF
jgi:hypothetical protein